MEDLLYNADAYNRRYKIIRTGETQYEVGVFLNESNNETFDFKMKLTLMPTGSDEGLPEYMLEPKIQQGVPSWVEKLGIVKILNNYIYQHTNNPNV